MVDGLERCESTNAMIERRHMCMVCHTVFVCEQCTKALSEKPTDKRDELTLYAKGVRDRDEHFVCEECDGVTRQS